MSLTCPMVRHLTVNTTPHHSMADEVSFLCKRTVVSTKPVQQGKFHTLSVLDRIMEHHHLLLVLYYHSPPGLKIGDLTRMLRDSISHVLCAFPIVTGRLVKNPNRHWMVKCNDAGLRMLEAKARGSVDEWLQNLSREKELKLVHWEPMFEKPYFWSTFYVQLTEFEGGGLAIGLSCTHLLADPTCATMFIKAWADTTLSGKMINPPFFHSLPPRRPMNRNNTNHNPYADQLIDHYKTTIQKPSSRPFTHEIKLTTIALEFKEDIVRICIAMASKDDHNPSHTPFEALAGLFWVCISKVMNGLKGGLIDMSLCLDMRKLLNLDKGFFGNCMVYNKVNGQGLCLSSEEHELYEAANAIRSVEMKMDTEGIQDLIGWLEQNEHEDPPLIMNGCDHLICANMEGVDHAYSAIFGDGLEPIYASYYVEPASGQGQVSILPSRPSTEGSFSRVVMVTLPQDEATKLLGLELIQQMSPAILMGKKTYKR